MADKKKKSGGGGAAKPSAQAETNASVEKKLAVDTPIEETAPETAEAISKDQKAALKADVHGAAAHAHGHDPAHAEAHSNLGHAPNIKEYFVIFAILAFLTLVEVVVAKIPGINHSLMALALVSLALTKAAIVGLYYMHLKHETRILKWTVAIPVAAPTLYAVVLISEAAWRLTRW
jgi:caa(3)-type oxidase subunit IV